VVVSCFLEDLCIVCLGIGGWRSIPCTHLCLLLGSFSLFGGGCLACAHSWNMGDLGLHLLIDLVCGGSYESSCDPPQQWLAPSCCISLWRQSRCLERVLGCTCSVFYESSHNSSHACAS
jgi:hypothetical protein